MRNALLLTMDPDRPDPFLGWFGVGDDGRLTAVEPGDPPAAAIEVLPGTRCSTSAGSWGRDSSPRTATCSPPAPRGLGMDQSLYGWIEAMLRYSSAGGTEDLYWLTRHGAQDFLRNGITTAYDFTDSGLPFDRESDGVAHYAASVPDPEYQHAQLRGKVDAGLRGVHSVMLGQGAVDPAAALAHLDDVVGLAADTDPSLLLRLAISGTVQWADAPEAAELEAAAMRRHGLLNQPHFLETPHEVELQQSKFGWYRDAGVLGPDLVFGHFIQTTDAIISEAAAAGCGMSWQPMSNGRLASGVARIPRIRELGMRVGIGLDDQSCTDVSDPFANMRTGLALRARHLPGPGGPAGAGRAGPAHPGLGGGARHRRPRGHAARRPVRRLPRRRPAAPGHRTGLGPRRLVRARLLAAQPPPGLVRWACWSPRAPRCAIRDRTRWRARCTSGWPGSAADVDGA